ncbi:MULTISPECIES: acyl carrier protein [Campylobacter]|uniref:acyl carrier protein n=1 Tax=Campylobacter TaxID=194 RepID=UPI00087469A3|nr:MULTISPECIES: acyl carrier protein [Campylobacter]ECK2570974.1 acyl carrier protein [Campylobacter jejuni]OEW25445.1 acyl carrier protein [Campylobacter sp. BCW_6889]OEW28216.1 acyl carrier protein [Campylobacter jejuni]RTI89250.1 acyl carrier protein [Campylobacter jejuni]HEC1906400.1 acyl carrier protein [Campylobacter jejuni]
MQEIKQFFINIGKGDIDENEQNLVSNDIIDSIDILNLVNEIEKYYNKTLDSDFMRSMYFESFESIQKMIKKAFDL